jgi:hypothetical protein
MQADHVNTATEGHENRNPWLHAWYDPLADLKTTTACVRLGDELKYSHFI